MRGQTDPFEQMEAMFEQMRRSAFGSLPAQPRPSEVRLDRPASRVPATGPRDAALSLDETDDGYRVVADLPGFERDEIELTYRDGTLTIAGSHADSGEDDYRRRTVSESVRIPGDVSTDDVSATYRNGVLEVTLPVANEERDGVRIDVE